MSLFIRAVLPTVKFSYGRFEILPPQFAYNIYLFTDLFRNLATEALKHQVLIPLETSNFVVFTEISAFLTLET